MVRVYYDTNSQELLTEQEANDKAFGIIQGEPQLYLDTLMSYPAFQIWEMLKDEEKENIINETINGILDEEFYCREFDDDELQ